MLGSSQPRRDRAIAEALVERGRAYYLLGQVEVAMGQFDQAIAVAPNRGETYADLIAFLAPRGDLTAAGRIYRAGMSRPDRDLTEYMKIYSSIWLLDNAPSTKYFRPASVDCTESRFEAATTYSARLISSRPR